MPTAVPIVNQNRGWRFWSVVEIYTGPTGTGEFVPNVDDAVWSWSEGLSRVISVNYLNGLSVLQSHSFENSNGGVLASDILLGSGPGSLSESYRVYVNTDVVPPLMAFDTRLRIYGSNATYVKVFRGTDTGVNGHVISGMFTGMTLNSENIPLETVVTPGVNNVAVKTIQQGWSIEALNDGEVVTCVTYDVNDNVLCVTKMIVKITNFIRSVDTSKKYVIGIELLSPFISVSNANLIECPVNMLMQSTSMQGKVIYNDGSNLVLPIDNGRFKIHGIDNYVSGEPGLENPVVLVYTLQPDEYSFIASAPSPSRFITENYTITTVEAQGAYSVKLFVVPKWVTSPVAKWDLDFYLYSLDRDTVLLATPYIEYSVTSPAFNGSLLDTPQNLTVAVNLSNVDPSYLYYRFLQSFTINLKASGSNGAASNYWQIEYEPSNFYGAGHKAKSELDIVNSPNRIVDISLGLVDVDDWLDEVYYPTKPLRYVNTEYTPPVPTHVRVKHGASFVRELTLIDALLPINNVPSTAIQGGTMRLEFFRRVSGVDYELSLAAMNIHF